MRANLFALLLIALIPASVFAEDCEPQRGGFLYLAEGQKIDSEHYAISIERQCDDELSIELQLFVGRHPNGMPINETLDTVKLFAAEKDFVGLWATSVQHQIDHINGKMYFDHLSRTKREMLLKKAGKVRS